MTDDEAIAQAADKYREEGYEVAIRPPVESLPPELRTRTPGLVARRNGESILVEIWSRDRLNDLPPDWMPTGWEFEIVHLPSKDGERMPTAEATPQAVERLLAEFDQFVPRGATAARFLLGWAATEGAMRVAARRGGVDRAAVTSRQLLSDLHLAGILAGGQYDAIRARLDTRNRLVHGLPVDELLADHADELARLARDLLAAEPARAAG